MRWLLTLAMTCLIACSSPAEPVTAEDVRGCLEEQLPGAEVADIPLSDTATVLAMDLGDNSVQIYVEPDEAAVAEEIDQIRSAELELGLTAEQDRVVLRNRGNVLVSWANEPEGEIRETVAACAGIG